MRPSSHSTSHNTHVEDSPPIMVSDTPSLRCTACLGEDFSLTIVRSSEGKVGLVRCNRCRRSYSVSIIKEVVA